MRQRPSRSSWRRAATALAGAACLPLLLTACRQSEPKVTLTESAPAATLAGTPFDPDRSSHYVLYPGDLLLIRYPTDASLDQQVRVRSDGMISLPYVGDVQAAGRAPVELGEELNEKSREQLQEPRIAVIVMEEEGRRFYIGGQVRTPGMLQLKPQQTLAQALYESGGLTAQANADQVMVFRPVSGEGTYVLTANVSRILAGQEPDVRLEPFDVVHVPETIIASVDRFVEQYINLIIPRTVNFPFFTELHSEPLEVINNSGAEFTPIQIQR